MDPSPKLSRRCVLKGVALLASAPLAATLGTRVASAQKASKEALKYQEKPNGNMQCDNCAQFVAPDTCKVIEGKVSPKGYCIAWVKK